MTGVPVDDRVARLIPWYAAGSLGAAESAEVESHLAGCDECRDLLALARGFRRLAPHVPQEALFDHVQAQRLVEFAEDPGTLEPETRRFVTSHIRDCRPCAEALEILEDMGRSSMAGDPQAMEGDRGAMPASSGPLEAIRKAMAELWGRLSRSVLLPAPALAYLAALLVLLVTLPMRRAGPGPVPRPAPVPAVAETPASVPAEPARIALLPPAIDLPEEAVFRDGAQAPPPLEVRPTDPAGTIVFDLITDLTREDLTDATARFRLIVAEGDRPILERECRAADFDRRGRLLLTIGPGTIAAGAPCLVRILRVAPGASANGEEVYRRAFVIVPPPSTR